MAADVQKGDDSRIAEYRNLEKKSEWPSKFLAEALQLAF
jgi:hypothetical protein